MPQLKPSADNQQGFASIVIALVMIIVLALLTVGFASLARREQQDALDKQLATQANYAAESGVNDIYNAIAAGMMSSTSATPAYQTWWQTYGSQVSGSGAGSNCLSRDALQGLNLSGEINQTDDIGYTCALVNLTPTSDQKSPAAPNTAWSSVFSTSGTLKSITVNWSSYDGQDTCLTNSIEAQWNGSGTTQFPSKSDWNASKAPPVLEVSLTPLGSGTGLTTQSLLDDTFTVYLYPNTSGGSVSYGGSDGATYDASNSANSDSIIGGNCSGGQSAVTINDIPGPGGATPAANDYYLIRIADLPYDAATWSWSPYSADGPPAANTTPLEVEDSQAVIDVTGQAKNVLKRLREVVSINGVDNNPGSSNSSSLPIYNLEAQNICKQFSTAPVIPASNPSGTTAGGGSCNVWQ